MMTYASVAMSYGIPTSTPQFIRVLMDITFFGEGVDGRDFAGVQVEIPGEATAAAIRTAIANAVRAKAIELGYELGPNSITMPQFTKA